MTAAKKIVGLISGSLMEKNVRIGPPPSMATASRTSLGSEPRAATNRMNTKPSCCQTATVTIVAVAPPDELSHGTSGRCSRPR
jgi:hypothetical protein